MNLKGLARGAVYQLGLAGLYYRIAARGASATAPDGQPLPPPHLMRLIGNRDAEHFLRSGEATAKAFAEFAAEVGHTFSGAQRILDFGCGCGRIIRHLPKHTDAALFGVDYNPALVDWCARNLKGEFSRNKLHPPLSFPDAHFDILYLMSVFTHLRIETQREWLAEFHRVLRPGGVALVTFHDEDQPGFPDDVKARAELEKTGVYIENDLAEGSNLIATFQTRDFTRKLFGEKFDVLHIAASNETPVRQAIAALRKPR